MNKLRYIFFTLFTIAIVSCETNTIDESGNVIAGFDYPITETGEDYLVTYKYNKSTIVYDEKSINYIHHIEADSILYYEKNTPNDYLPSTGDVVSTRITETTPYGLGNKVLSIINTGSYYKCVTTSAALNEIYDKLDFVFDSDDISKMAENMEIYEEENNISNRKSMTTRGVRTDEKINIIEIPLGKLSKKGVVISGNIELTGRIHAEGSLEENTFEYYFEPKFAFKGKAGIGVEYKKNLWQDIDEFKTPLFKSPKADLGPLVIGPLVLRPYIAAEGYVDFNASGAVTMDFEQTLSTKWGYRQHSGAYADALSYTPPSEIIKGVSINGNVGLKFKGVFDVGLGMYVKDVAVELDPYFSTGIGLNFRAESLKDKNTLDCVANFDVGAGAEAKFVVDFFGKLRLGPKVKLLDNNFYHKEWPLIPIYERKSMCIAGASSTGTFDGNYIVNSGFLGNYFPVTPAVNIYDANHKILRCQKFEGPRVITQDTFIKFNLSQLKDSKYYVHPCLIFKINNEDIPCESEECFEIKGKTNVEILSVRQTSYKQEEHDCDDNCGIKYHHIFGYDVDIRVNGSANCVECGYCIDYVHNRRGYYPVDNFDGIHTISNALLFTSSNPTLVIYPYVKYSDGEIEVGEPFSTQFFSSSNAKAIYLKQKKSKDGKNTISYPSLLK